MSVSTSTSPDFFTRRPISTLALLLGGLLLTTSCEKVQQARNTANAISALSEAGKNLEKEAAQAQDRQAERRAKGDTLAMPYKDLQKLLPESVGDYKPAGEPEGSMMTMTGMSYSTAARTYETGEGDQKKTLKISIVDYNQAGMVYAGATAMMGANFQMEDEQQRVQGLDLGVADAKALETYRKQEHKASIIAGIGQRFFVSVEANEQPDTELVKTAIKDLDLQALAAR